MRESDLGEFLISFGIIDAQQLQTAKRNQVRFSQSPRSLSEVLIEMGVVSEDEMMNLLSHHLNIPMVQLKYRRPDAEALTLLDGAFCRKNVCLPFRYQEHGRLLDVAMFNATSQELFDHIRFKTNCYVRPHLAGKKDIEYWIDVSYFGGTQQRRRTVSQVVAPILLDEDQESREEHTVDVTDFGPAQAMNPLEHFTELQFDNKGAAQPVPPSHKLAEEISDLQQRLEANEQLLERLIGVLVQRGVCSHLDLTARGPGKR